MKMKKTLTTLVVGLAICGTTQFAQAEEKSWTKVCVSPLELSGDKTLVNEFQGRYDVDTSVTPQLYYFPGTNNFPDKIKCSYGGSISISAPLEGYNNCRLEGEVNDRGDMQKCDNADECKLVCEES